MIESRHARAAAYIAQKRWERAEQRRYQIRLWCFGILAFSPVIWVAIRG